MSSSSVNVELQQQLEAHVRHALDAERLAWQFDEQGDIIKAVRHWVRLDLGRCFWSSCNSWGHYLLLHLLPPDTH